MLERVQRPIFAVVIFGEEGPSRGTAFGIRPDLLMSCEHVVRGASEVVILSERLLFDGERKTIAEVVRVDEKRDLALLKISTPAVHSLELSASQQPDDKRVNIEFAISDTGIGISKEDQETIFELFKQVTRGFRRAFGGAGIGLTICRKIIALMGLLLMCSRRKGEPGCPPAIRARPTPAKVESRPADRY